jgi:hypothetical protein
MRRHKRAADIEGQVCPGCACAAGRSRRKCQSYLEVEKATKDVVGQKGRSAGGYVDIARDRGVTEGDSSHSRIWYGLLVNSDFARAKIQESRGWPSARSCSRNRDAKFFIEG